MVDHGWVMTRKVDHGDWCTHFRTWNVPHVSCPLSRVSFMSFFVCALHAAHGSTTKKQTTKQRMEKVNHQMKEHWWLDIFLFFFGFVVWLCLPFAISICGFVCLFVVVGCGLWFGLLPFHWVELHFRTDPDSSMSRVSISLEARLLSFVLPHVPMIAKAVYDSPPPHFTSSVQCMRETIDWNHRQPGPSPARPSNQILMTSESQAAPAFLMEEKQPLLVDAFASELLNDHVDDHLSELLGILPVHDSHEACKLHGSKD